MRRAVSIGIKGFIYLFSLLPYWLLFRISDLVYLVLNYLVKYRAKVIEDNLRNAFPEKDSAQLKEIKNSYYKHLSDLLVESIKLFSVKPHQVTAKVKVINPELIKQYMDNGRSVIGVLGHYGNWEMGALRFSQLFDEQRIVVYKPLSNPSADSFVKAMRSRFGASLVTMRQIPKTLLSLKGKPTVSVMVSDQTPPKSEIQYFTDFLNQPTAVYLGVEKLAKVTNSVVVFCDLRKQSRGQYTCTFVSLADNPADCPQYEITERHVRYLQEVIREAPEYWLWSHRRWKFKPDSL